MTVKKTRTTPSLTRVATRLKADLATLRDAFHFADTATREFLAERTGSRVTHQVTTSYAAWVHFTCGDDLDKYTEFLERVLEARAKDATSLFGWEEPPLVTPNPEADRLLDRIDLGLHFVQRRLVIKLPRELKRGDEGYSIRSGGGKTNEMLARVGAFVDAASDLFA
jgi:hypothetical protein